MHNYISYIVPGCTTFGDANKYMLCTTVLQSKRTYANPHFGKTSLNVEQNTYSNAFLITKRKT